MGDIIYETIWHARRVECLETSNNENLLMSLTFLGFSMQSLNSTVKLLVDNKIFSPLLNYTLIEFIKLPSILTCN